MSLFSSQLRVFLVAAVFRLVLLVYGGWQDANSAVKYTDIDYMVFTDAARYVANGKPPYARDTYRYTPLLAWMLLPTAWESSAPSALTFAFGKILFALADVLAGWLVVQLLCRCYHFPTDRALRYVSAIWLWNPMVANISTRGSAEGLLGVLVAALLWATLTRRPVLAGGILSLAVHFKIYPFIYGVSMIWWWDAERDGSVSTSAESGWVARAIAFITPSRVKLTLSALVTFATLNLVMYLQYGMPFVQHTFFHHLTRIDHRHNFSPYSTLLYLSAAGGANSHFEALAFLPQLILAVMALPLVLAKKCLASAMLAQTFAFVTFNKVCTSQVWNHLLVSSRIWLTRPVLFVVSYPPPVLPAIFVTDAKTGCGHLGGGSVGGRTGMFLIYIRFY